MLLAPALSTGAQQREQELQSDSVATSQITQQAEQSNEAQHQPDMQPLPIGKTVERQLKGGETHKYIVELKQGQVLRIDAQEKGVSIRIRLIGISDSRVIASADFGPGYDRKRLTAVAEQAGGYEVVVVAPPLPMVGEYRLGSTVRETATASDNEEIKAERLVQEGLASRNKRSAEGLRTAIAKWEEALPLWKKLGEKYWEGYLCTFLGRVYDDLGENQKALDYLNQALPLTRLVGDKRGEAATLNNISKIYSDSGEKRKALEVANQALPLLREIGDKRGEAIILTGIGKEHDDLGEKQEALGFYNQALPLRRLVGDKGGEAATLHNMGTTYASLGEDRKALGYLNQARQLFRSVNDKRGEAATLNNSGSIHDELGEKREALEYLNQALSICRLIGDKGGEAATLNNIGGVHSHSGEKREALGFYNQALQLNRLIGDIRGEAATLNSIGLAYSALGERQEALRFYNQALPLRKAVGNPNDEGVTLYCLMVVWKILGNPRLAIFYGKQSINAFQQMRSNIQFLDKGLQRSFLVSQEDAYRDLAELLISQNRLQEAVQVLDLLKLQEFSDFINRSGSPERPTAEADFSPSEAEKNKQYDQLADRLFALNREYDGLAKKKARTPGEEQRLATLGQEIEGARQQFQQFIAQLPDYFSPPLTAQEAGIEINGIKPIVRDLGAGTVALYTLIAQDRYYVILISPQADQVRHYAIRRDELENKVVEFKRAVQNRERDPQPKAHELYQILLAPIDTELQQAGARTLMWSLDGVLRYLPISALHDGQQYVVAKYQNVVIDPTSQSRLREQPAHLNWRGLGLGTSKAFAGLKALSNVPEELDEIIREEGGKDERGVLPGEAMLNESFTELRMFEALKRNYTVVHIASHFVLSAKDASQSYLLLGDGNRLKLSQISEGAKIFDRVDLVALSACDTASGGEDADGREVDAFGIITQQKGARAVLASLWPVEDRSTKDLMVDFYQRLRGAGQLSKAEALRLAQLGLLRGGVQGLNAQDSPRSDSDKKKDPVKVKEMQWEEETGQGPEFKVDPKARYGHPYYWAPFILIGNWK
jgi:CHAT domain-containing protein/Flp pilus assembly protein TadD